jgi:hypothetical protein
MEPKLLLLHHNNFVIECIDFITMEPKLLLFHHNNLVIECIDFFIVSRCKGHESSEAARAKDYKLHLRSAVQFDGRDCLVTFTLSTFLSVSAYYPACEVDLYTACVARINLVLILAILACKMPCRYTSNTSSIYLSRYRSTD